MAVDQPAVDGIWPVSLDIGVGVFEGHDRGARIVGSEVTRGGHALVDLGGFVRADTAPLLAHRSPDRWTSDSPAALAGQRTDRQAARSNAAS